MRLPSFLIKALIAATAITATASERIYFPNPQGPYHVGKTQQVVAHTTHNDPAAPKGSNQTQSFFLLSMWYPTHQEPTESSSLQYMDLNLTRPIETFYELPKHSLRKLWTPIQWQPPPIQGVFDVDDRPTVLLSPGLLEPCVASSVLSADLASQGYRVLCIDHPGEPPYLQLPDGSGVPGQISISDISDIAFIGDVYAYRLTDMRALIAKLPNLTSKSHSIPIPNSPTFLGVGVSLGGATISGVMDGEDRICGGVNLDGGFWIDYRHDLGRPFLLMSEPAHNSTNDPTWQAWEEPQTGWWEDLSVQGALHLDFTDAALILELLGIPPSPDKLQGNINGFRMRTITTAFVEAFFNQVTGKGDGMLQGPLPNQQWPDVVRVASSKDQSSHSTSSQLHARESDGTAPKLRELR